MTARLYLDHNATAPPAPGVREALARAWGESWGNPSSIHAEGRRARALVERVRAQVAAATGARPDEVVLCSGGSEADALALRGLVAAGRVETLVVGALEHPAVLETARDLAASGACALRVAAARAEGTVDPAAVDAALAGTRAALVAVMLAQNEIGTLMDVGAIAAVARTHGALLLSDAVQALGKVPIDVEALGADLLAVSAHKIGGPPGCGALIVRGGLPLVPFCSGGGQELGRRQGTEGLVALAGFGAALEGLTARLAAAPRVAAARDTFERILAARLAGVSFAGAAAPRLPNTSAVLVEGVAGVAVVRACDALGLAVSAGSACHSATGGTTGVAAALGLDHGARRGMVRVSGGCDFDDAQAEAAAAMIAAAVSGIRTR